MTPQELDAVLAHVCSRYGTDQNVQRLITHSTIMFRKYNALETASRAVLDRHIPALGALYQWNIFYREHMELFAQMPRFAKLVEAHLLAVKVGATQTPTQGKV